MKRLMILFLSLLLLCGCSSPDAAPETAPPEPIVTQAPPIETEAPTEPAGFYAPDSRIEQETGGAVKAYPLMGTHFSDAVPFCDGFLLFYTADTTILTKLSGANLYPTATVTLDTFCFADEASVSISDKGITYFDNSLNELVFLDTNLKEVARQKAPDGLVGEPALSSDRKTFYYFTSDSLRVLDLETGLDRLLKQTRFLDPTIAAMHCDGQIIECSASDENYNWLTMYIDTQTGETVYETTDYFGLETGGGRYYTRFFDGDFPENLVGLTGEEPSMLYLPNYRSDVYPVLDCGGVVAATMLDDSTTFDYYALEDGTHRSSITTELLSPWRFTADPQDNALWFLAFSNDYNCDVLYRWDLDLSAVADDTVYIGLRRTADNPDLYGLEQCSKLAKEISDQYGVRVQTWTDAVAFEPWDYDLVAEHQVPLLRESLQMLDQALSNFPEGFFREAASQMGDGVLRIGILRAMYGVEDSGALESASGIQFWDDDGNPYICVQAVGSMEQNLYHELFHIIDSRVLSTCDAYDNWNKLNPKGFEYDYDYIANADRDDYGLTSGDEQAFIDIYSMSYPKEDRARIMEYAMMPDQEDLFRSETMQRKLKTLCLGIREAFDLEDVAAPFLWEQYLTEPIHPQA